MSSALLQLLWDLPGWLLLPVTFIVCIPATSRKQRVLLALWFTIGLHQCAALTDCYLFLIPGGDADAEGFHRRAAGELLMVAEPMPYDVYLTFLYQALGPSKLLGCQLSILAYALSALVFLRLVRWVDLERYEVPLVLAYGCLPGALFHRSVTMREPYQALALLIVMWMLAILGERKNQTLPYVGLGLSLLGMFMLHNGLAVFALVVAGVSVVRGARHNPLQTMIIVLIATGAIAFTSRGDILRGKSSALDELGSGRLDAYMADYRERLDVTRASYRVQLDTRSADGFLITFPQVVTLYFYAPFPWQAKGLKDFYALSESMLRMVLTVGTVVNFLGAGTVKRRKLLLIAIIFLALEAMWAAGTANWGQAIRHRTVGYGLFLLLGAEPVLRALYPQAASGEAA